MQRGIINDFSLQEVYMAITHTHTHEEKQQSCVDYKCQMAIFGRIPVRLQSVRGAIPDPPQMGARRIPEGR